MDAFKVLNKNKQIIETALFDVESAVIYIWQLLLLLNMFNLFVTVCDHFEYFANFFVEVVETIMDDRNSIFFI